jgi:hypothetical protein
VEQNDLGLYQELKKGTPDAPQRDPDRGRGPVLQEAARR